MRCNFFRPCVALLVNHKYVPHHFTDMIQAKQEGNDVMNTVDRECAKKGDQYPKDHRGQYVNSVYDPGRSCGEWVIELLTTNSEELGEI